MWYSLLPEVCLAVSLKHTRPACCAVKQDADGAPLLALTSEVIKQSWKRVQRV